MRSLAGSGVGQVIIGSGGNDSRRRRLLRWRPWARRGAIAACSACRRRGSRAAWRGLAGPWAAMHSAGSSADAMCESKSGVRHRRRRIRGAGGRPDAGIGADAAPLTVADFEDFEHAGAGGGVAFAGDGAHVLIFHCRRGLVRVGATSMRMASSRSSGSKPPTTKGTWKSRPRSSYSDVAHDGADVAGRDEALHAIAGEAEQQANGRRHEDVGDQHGEVRQALACGLPDGHGVGRRGGFEADGEEDDLAIGFWRAIATASMGE